MSFLVTTCPPGLEKCLTHPEKGVGVHEGTCSCSLFPGLVLGGPLDWPLTRIISSRDDPSSWPR